MTQLSHYKTNSNDPEYRPIKVISNGSFGFVFQAEHVITKQKVALKRIRRINSDLGRQYDVLTLIRGCQNIVDIKDIFFTRNQNRVVQNIIFEYVDDNLEDLMERNIKEGKRIPEMTIKSYVYQILNGVHQMHQNKIAHRDLKPENILLSKSGKIKICDFGHSKILDQNGKNTPFVVSRVYRAPELLLCITKYTTAIDIWSVGCILAELFILKPVFDGNTEGNQLFKIFRYLGSLSPHEKKQYEQKIPFDKTLLKSMGPFARQDLKENFKMVEDLDNFIDLFTKLLKYIPQKRLTAKQAMEHPFFNNVKKRIQLEDQQQSTRN